MTTLIPFTLDELPERRDYHEIDYGCSANYKLNKSWKSLFDSTVGDLLTGMNWVGYALAGGALWRCLSNNMEPETDLDFFIYGVDEDSRADSLLSLLTHFKQKDSNVSFTVYGSVIDVSGLLHDRKIQIICTNKKSINEVLDNFDFSHLQLAWSGQLHTTLLGKWSVCNGITIPMTTVRQERLEKTQHYGLKVWYKSDQYYMDPYGVRKTLDTFKYTGYSPVEKKVRYQCQTQSLARVLTTVRLDGVFDREAKDYNCVQTLPGPISVNDTSLNYVSFKQGKHDMQYVKYNDYDLILKMSGTVHLRKECDDRKNFYLFKPSLMSDLQDFSAFLAKLLGYIKPKKSTVVSYCITDDGYLKFSSKLNLPVNELICISYQVKMMCYTARNWNWSLQLLDFDVSTNEIFAKNTTMNTSQFMDESDEEETDLCRDKVAR